MDNFESIFNDESTTTTAAANGGSISWWMWILLAYGLAEAIFPLVVYLYWLPKLDQPRDPPIIRHFEDHDLRHKLFERMLKRNEDLCLALGIDMKQYFTQYIRNWFFLVPQSGDDDDDANEDDNNNNNNNNTEDKSDQQGHGDDAGVCIKETGLPYKDDIDKLISWGYFNVDSKDMTEEWQQRELAKIYAMMKDKHNMEPGPKSKQKLQAVQMTIEPLCIKYRPFLFYIICFAFKSLATMTLYFYGFSYHTSSTGLSYWYRPATATKQDGNTGDNNNNQNNNNSSLPLLFFHGIAPAGSTFYIPMLIYGMATDEDINIGRDIFLFQNPAVTFGLTDHAPTEKETTEGVWEAVDKHCGPTAEVSTMGHSFGACLQTYIMHSTQSHRVRQMVLLDPVSILLSDPDVITNFVYCRGHHRDTKLDDSVPNPGSAGWVMNEIFIEHFLRRQFAWYNGELFLEDIPDHCKVIACLSDEDAIVNAQKVKAHIDIYNGHTPSVPRDMVNLKQEQQQPNSTTNSGSSPTASTSGGRTSTISRGGSSASSALSSTSSGSLESAGRQKLDVIYWENRTHGDCLFDTSMWPQVRRMMKIQEQQIYKEKSL